MSDEKPKKGPKKKGTKLTPKKRQELESLLNSNGQKLLQDFKSQVHSESSSTLRSIWTMGQLMEEAQKNQAKYFNEQGSTYGLGIVKTLATLADYDESHIRKSMLFRSTYPTTDALQDLLRVKTSSGKPLLWGHVQLLLVYRNEPKKRDELMKKVVEHDLSPQELHSEIKRQRKGPARAGGRPITVPKTVAAKADQFNEFCRKFMRQYEENWCHESEGIVKMLDQMAGDQIKRDLLDKLAESVARIRELREKLADFEEVLVKSKEDAGDRVIAQNLETADNNVASMEAETPDGEKEGPRGRTHRRRLAAAMS